MSDESVDDFAIGSCENCGCNLYASDGVAELCDQCDWMIEQAALEYGIKPGGDSV